MQSTTLSVFVTAGIRKMKRFLQLTMNNRMNLHSCDVSPTKHTDRSWSHNGEAAARLRIEKVSSSGENVWCSKLYSTNCKQPRKLSLWCHKSSCLRDLKLRCLWTIKYKVELEGVFHFILSSRRKCTCGNGRLRTSLCFAVGLPPSASLESSGLLKLKMSRTSLSQHVLGHAQLRPNVMMCIQRMIHGQYKSSLQSDF